MNCTECSKAKQDLQIGDYYCTQKGCLVGKQEDCEERDDYCCDYNASCGCWDRMGYMCCDSQGATGR